MIHLLKLFNVSMYDPFTYHDIFNLIILYLTLVYIDMVTQNLIRTGLLCEIIYAKTEISVWLYSP